MRRAALALVWVSFLGCAAWRLVSGGATPRAVTTLVAATMLAGTIVITRLGRRAGTRSVRRLLAWSARVVCLGGTRPLPRRREVV